MDSIVVWHATLSDDFVSGSLAISLQDQNDFVKFIDLVSPSDGKILFERARAIQSTSSFA